MSKQIKKTTKIPKAIFGSDKTPLRLGAIDIPCYVLEDGTRVLSRSGIQKAIGYTGRSGEMLIRLVTEKNGFPKEIVAGVSNSLKFERIDAGGSQPITNGYEASTFIDICTTLIDLKRAGVLTPSQEIYADFADIIVRSVAKVGIIALIDEATGYQEVRDKDALQKFLDKFLLKERAKWVSRFPDEFFEVLFKMKGWTLNYASTKKPQFVGKFINDLVYDRLAPLVHEELKKINPVVDRRTGRRKGKHHSWLTEEIGVPKLQEHLFALITLAKASGLNWGSFYRMVQRSLPKYGENLQIDYGEEK